LTAAVVLLLIVGVGLGGATLSTSLLADNTDSSLAPTDDREWTEYETIVVFRNDDIQPWYKADTRRAVDRVFIEEDVPVTLGVIPAVNGADSPITDNGRTCGYLRSLLTEHPGQFEIALHGYTHDRRTGFYNGSEFGGIDPATQQRWMTTGTEIIRSCTGVTPQTFIPPMNTYDTGTVEAANTADYRTISGGDWFTRQYYNETGVFVAGGLVHASEGVSFVDWERDELHSQAELQAEFNDSYESNSLHIQMLHYQSFDTEADREKLRQLIRHMKSTDTAFLTVDQLTTGLQNGDIRETEEVWEIREPLEPPANSPDRLESSTGVDRLFSMRAVS
jgi:predicted deacetylase